MRMNGCVNDKFSVRFDRGLYEHWQRRAKRWTKWARVKYSNLHLIPKSGPAVIACNHLNWKDVFFIGAMVPRPVSFAATVELFDEALCHRMLNHYFDQYVRIPIVKEFIHSFNRRLAKFLVDRIPYSGAFAVKRQAHNRCFFEAAKSVLLQNKLVCIFPEGGTGKPGQLRRLKQGATKIVYDLYLNGLKRIPVIPVGISGTHKFYHPGMLLQFHVGQPLYIDDFFIQSDKRETLLRFTTALSVALNGLSKPKATNAIKEIICFSHSF